MSGAADPLAAFVSRTLDRPAPPDVARLAASIARRPGVAAVLFYGNRLRDPAAPGLADLYVLTDTDRAWRGPGLSAAACRLLPPNVYHLREDAAPSLPGSPPLSARPQGRAAPDLPPEGAMAMPPAARPESMLSSASPGQPPRPALQVGRCPPLAGDEPAGRENARDGSAKSHQADAPAPPDDHLICAEHKTGVGAKVAVMRLAAFRHRMRRDSRDTTLWARFAQPAALIYARDAAARAAVVDAVATAWRTAAHWADRLSDGPDRWAGLFAATYAAELRPEGTARRPAAITAAAPELYAGVDRLLPAEQVSDGEKRAARRDWRRRCRAGRALNAARLVKAAATFRGGAAYALSKIERHAGPDALSPWERRLPWLAAPVVLLRLLRRGDRR